MSRDGFVVPPLSKAKIVDVAQKVRQPFTSIFGLGPYVPMDRVLELLPEMLDGFEFQVCDESEMGTLHGETEPLNRLVRLRRDVYDGMCQGNGRDRFTAAHELGHLFLHTSTPTFARRSSKDAKIYCCSEWQADTFASAFLIDEAHLAKCHSIEQVQQMFGVSASAAAARFRR